MQVFGQELSLPEGPDAERLILDFDSTWQRLLRLGAKNGHVTYNELTEGAVST